jgi:hypothetical protein
MPVGRLVAATILTTIAGLALIAFSAAHAQNTAALVFGY